MSGTGTRVSVSVEAGVKVRRADAIYGILTFVADVLRISKVHQICENGVLKNQWVTRLRFVGLDGDGSIAEELVFEIDWDRHQLHMNEGRGTVTVPNGRSLVASVSPDLLTSLRLFKESCIRKELETGYYVTVRSIPGRNRLGELGLVACSVPGYAGAKLQVSFRTDDLDEVSGSYNRYGP